MRTLTSSLFLVACTLLTSSAMAQQGDNVTDSVGPPSSSASETTDELRRQLQGFWTLKQAQANSEGHSYRKCWGDNDWAITTYLPDGSIHSHHGGTYVLTGNQYTETIVYAAELTKDWIGKTYNFTIQVDGDSFIQHGIDNKWTETWTRLRRQPPKDARLDSNTGHIES